MQFDSNNYVPRTFTPITPGKYAFDVLNATEKTSDKGNEMIVLELGVKVPGRENPVKVYDYLVAYEKDGEIVLDKIASFCAATGLTKHFQSGALDDVVCMGVSGKAKFKLEPNDKGDEYLKVAYYLAKEGFSESPKPRISPENAAKIQQVRESFAPPVGAGAPQVNDDIPF